MSGLLRVWVKEIPQSVWMRSSSAVGQGFKVWCRVGKVLVFPISLYIYNIIGKRLKEKNQLSGFLLCFFKNGRAGIF